MTKARDIMSSALITCSPDTALSEAARLMRDGDTGDVLVVDKGKLKGIVTDRDITMYMASHEDASDSTVKDLMSTHVITGETNWDLDKIADKMKKHQIRRLPITENDRLVGIVSFGDLARYDDHRSRVADALKHISEPHQIHRRHARGRSWVWGTLGMVLAIATATILTLSPRTLRTMQKQLQEAHLDEKAYGLFEKGRDRIAKRASDINAPFLTRVGFTPKRRRRFLNRIGF